MTPTLPSDGLTTEPDGLTVNQIGYGTTVMSFNVVAGSVAFVMFLALITSLFAATGASDDDDGEPHRSR